MKRIKKVMACLLLLCFTCNVMFFSQTAEAATKTGTYYKRYTAPGVMAGMYPTYSVIINSIKSGKVKFQVEFVGRNGSPIYYTNIIQSSIKNNKSSFKWKDTWGNSGKGNLILGTNYLKVKMVVTKYAKMNRGSLETAGRSGASTSGYLKLLRKSSNKKLSSW